MKKNTAARQGSAFMKEDAAALKGVAILMMMMHHCFRETSLYEGFTISFVPFAEAAVVRFSLFLKICVSLFAFISGYGLFLNYRKNTVSATRWVAGRYVSTFSGYWFVWVFAAIGCQIVNGRFVSILFKEGVCRGLLYTAIDFSGLARLFRTPTLNGTWWYMSAAAVFIVLIPLVFRLRKHLPLVLIGSVLLLRVLSGSNGDGTFTGENSVWAFLSPFLFGCLFAERNVFDRWIAIGRGVWWIKAIKLVLEAGVLVLLYRMYHEVPKNMFWEFHFGVVPVAVILFLAEFVLRIPGLKQVLRFFGKHSYNIFLVHTAIRAYYLHDFTYSLKHFLLVVLFLFASSLVISLIIELLKKGMRYRALTDRILNRIAGERKPAAGQ